MNNIAGFKVVDLLYVEFADAEECDCGEGMHRWVDEDGRKWCEKCIGRIESCWREVFPQ